MGVECTIIEAPTGRVKDFLGDAHCVAAEDSDDGYQFTSYERDDDVTIFVISAGGKSIIYKVESQRRPP